MQIATYLFQKTSLFEENLLFSNTLKVDVEQSSDMKCYQSAKILSKTKQTIYTNYVCEAILHAGVKDERGKPLFPVSTYIPIVHYLSVYAERRAIVLGHQ